MYQNGIKLKATEGTNSVWFVYARTRDHLVGTVDLILGFVLNSQFITNKSDHD
jgi:hypothetical protein